LQLLTLSSPFCRMRIVFNTHQNEGDKYCNNVDDDQCPKWNLESNKVEKLA
jgi:hypothetical protein